MNELEKIYELLCRLKKNKERWNELQMEYRKGFKANYGLIPPGDLNISDLHLSKEEERFDKGQLEIINQIKEDYQEFVLSKLKEINNFKIALIKHEIDLPPIDLNVLFDTQELNLNNKSAFSVVLHFLRGKYLNFEDFVRQVTTQEEYFSEEEIIIKDPQGVFEQFPYQSLLSAAKWILNDLSVLNGNRLTCIGRGIRAKIQLESDENLEMPRNEKWLVQLIKDFVFAKDIDVQLQLFSKKNNIDSNWKLVKEVQARYQ